MHKALLLICCLIYAFYLTGQIEKPVSKGNISIGGAVALNTTNNSSDDGAENKSSSFIVMPSIGYFVSNRLEIGLLPIISISKSTNKSYRNDSNLDLTTEIDNSSQAYGLAPYVSYYFKNGFFCTSQLYYTQNFTRDENSLNGFIKSADENTPINSKSILESKYKNFGYSVGLGYAYFINSKSAIDASFSYSGSIKKYNYKYYTDGLAVEPNQVKKENKGNGLYFSIGMKVFI